MTVYIIGGEYPHYTLTTDPPSNVEDTAADMHQIMSWFHYRLNPGDTIKWNKP